MLHQNGRHFQARVFVTCVLLTPVLSPDLLHHCHPSMSCPRSMLLFQAIMKVRRSLRPRFWRRCKCAILKRSGKFISAMMAGPIKNAEINFPLLFRIAHLQRRQKRGLKDRRTFIIAWNKNIDRGQLIEGWQWWRTSGDRTGVNKTPDEEDDDSV